MIDSVGSPPLLVCPDCGGRVHLLATLDDTSAGGLRSAGPVMIDKILPHLGLPVGLALPTPPRDPPWLAGALAGCDAEPEPAPPDLWPH